MEGDRRAAAASSRSRCCLVAIPCSFVLVAERSGSGLSDVLSPRWPNSSVRRRCRGSAPPRFSTSSRLAVATPRRAARRRSEEASDAGQSEVRDTSCSGGASLRAAERTRCSERKRRPAAGDSVASAASLAGTAEAVAGRHLVDPSKPGRAAGDGRMARRGAGKRTRCSGGASLRAGERTSCSAARVAACRLAGAGVELPRRS